MIEHVVAGRRARCAHNPDLSLVGFVAAARPTIMVAGLPSNRAVSTSSTVRRGARALTHPSSRVPLRPARLTGLPLLGRLLTLGRSLTWCTGPECTPSAARSRRPRVTWAPSFDGTKFVSARHRRDAPRGSGGPVGNTRPQDGLPAAEVRRRRYCSRAGLPDPGSTSPRPPCVAAM